MRLARRAFGNSLLILIITLLLLPVYLALVAASHDGHAMVSAPWPYLPGRLLWSNMKSVLTEGMSAMGGQPLWRLLVNSFWMATLIALGKIGVALCSAFSLVYFNLPYKKWFFALIFSTMMLPVEIRIVPTFQVVASFGWLNSVPGLTLPLMASATATFLFRQFFKTLRPELAEAAILDGATPWRFFWDILLPLSKGSMGALFIILFVYGWNQYLWPLVITSSPQKATIVMGLRYLVGVADTVPQWHLIMCVALCALLPPCLIVLGAGRRFEKGLIH